MPLLPSSPVVQLVHNLKSSPAATFFPKLFTFFFFFFPTVSALLPHFSFLVFFYLLSLHCFKRSQRGGKAECEIRLLLARARAMNDNSDTRRNGREIFCDANRATSRVSMPANVFILCLYGVLTLGRAIILITAPGNHGKGFPPI